MYITYIFQRNPIISKTNLSEIKIKKLMGQN